MSRYSEMIFDVINHSHDHLTAEQIYMKLKSENSSLVLATVYNNLNSLVRDGKIRKLSVENGPDHYDRIERHDHMICSECGKIRDVYLRDLTEEIQQETGTEIQGYDLQIRYICEECRKRHNDQAE